MENGHAGRREFFFKLFEGASSTIGARCTQKHVRMDEQMWLRGLCLAYVLLFLHASVSCLVTTLSLLSCFIVALWGCWMVLLNFNYYARHSGIFDRSIVQGWYDAPFFPLWAWCEAPCFVVMLWCCEGVGRLNFIVLCGVLLRRISIGKLLKWLAPAPISE